MPITNVNSLLEDGLKDIYDFEKRLVRAIPKMVKAATSEELRSGLTEHLEVTRQHVQRIEQIFELLDLPAKAKTCNGMKGILAEGEEALTEKMEPSLRDVAIAGAAQRVEHYEMAAYAAARAIAEHLGNSQVTELLEQTWDEEREADEKLNEVAAQILKAGAVEDKSARTPKMRKAGG